MTGRRSLEDRLDTLLNAADILIDTAIGQIDPPGPNSASIRDVQEGCNTLRVARHLVSQARFLPKEEAQVKPDTTPVRWGAVKAEVVLNFENEPFTFPRGPGVLSHKDDVWTFTPATLRTVPETGRAAPEVEPCGHETTRRFKDAIGPVKVNYFWCDLCGALGVNHGDGEPTSWRLPAPVACERHWDFVTTAGKGGAPDTSVRLDAGRGGAPDTSVRTSAGTGGAAGHIGVVAPDVVASSPGSLFVSGGTLHVEGRDGVLHAVDGGKVAVTDPPDPYEGESPRRRELREKYRTQGVNWPGHPLAHGGLRPDYCTTCEGPCFIELLRMGSKI